MRYQLLAVDIDGTLLDPDRRIRPRVREALAAAQALGVRLALVTGRRPPAARRVAQELGLGLLPLVLHNGALVFDGEVLLRCLPLGREVALRAIRIGRELKAGPVVHCGLRGEGRLLFEDGAPQSVLVAYYLDRGQRDLRLVPDLEAALGDDTIQVMFGGEIEPVAALEPVLAAGLGAAARLERTVYPERGVALLDILDPRVGKAAALRFLCGHLGLPLRSTLAIGDNWNDREMLLEAGQGLVMGNAAPELLQLGLPLLPGNDEDGLAVGVERYILGSASGDPQE